MKVAIFTDSFLPGIGDEVMVVAPNYPKKNDDGSYPFKVVRFKSLPVTGNDMWAMPALSFKAKKAIDKFAPDIIHCQHWGMTCGYAAKYAKKHGVPLLFVIHTKFDYCYKHAFGSFSPIPFFMIKNGVRRLKKADAVCTVSYAMSKTLDSYGYKKPVTVIKNGVNRNNFNAEKRKKATDDPFVFLFVGLIISYKNIAFSLRALAEVKKVRNDFTFYLVGKGPHVKKFKRLAAKLKLSDNVVFTGPITDRIVLSEKYAQADLFLFPSVFDNDGLVIMEAAANGTPSLVLKNTGSAERITDGESGFFSEPTEKAYAEKILYLMEHRNQLYCISDGGKMPEYAPWIDTVKEYKKLYASLLADRAGE